MLQKKGFLKVMAVRDFLLVLLVAVDFFAVVAISFAKLRGAGNVELQIGTVRRVLLLNDLLLPMVALMLGKMFALLFRRRWSGYIGIFAVVFLCFGLFEKINQVLYLTVGINLDAIFRFFQLKQPNDSWVADMLYLVPAETYRVFLFLFWIAVCGMLISVACIRRKGVCIFSVVVFGAVCLICGGQVGNAGNYLNYDLNYANATNKATEFAGDASVEETAADFSIEKCSLKLTFGKEMEAEAVLELGSLSENSSAFELTLYRGYQVTSITDEDGNELDYDRTNDYLTVYAQGNLSEIHLSYHGFSQTFYANRNAVMLPGYFAYYPQAGHRPVFWNEVVNSIQYYGFNVEDDGLQETMYEISVSGRGTVYSNLEDSGGKFAGYTKVPILMGGAAAKETGGGTDLIYPALVDVSQVSLEELKEIMVEDAKQLGMDTDVFSNIKHLIFVPSTVYIGNDWGESVISGDCLFLGTDQAWTYDAESIALEIVMSSLDVRGDKSYLEAILQDVLRESRYLQDLEPLSEEEFFAVVYDKEDVEAEGYQEMIMNSSLERMYLLLLDTFDEDTVMRETVDYLQDEERTENCAEFLQDLYRTLEQ